MTTPISRVGGCVLAAVVISLILVPRATAVEGKPFGIAKFTVQTTQPKAVPYGLGIPGPGFINEPYLFTQAGGHPSQLTSVLEFDGEELGNGSVVPTRDPRDTIIDLPPGLTANPLAVPRCSLTAAVRYWADTHARQASLSPRQWKAAA